MSQAIAAELRALGERVMRRLSVTGNCQTRAYDHKYDGLAQLSYDAADFLEIERLQFRRVRFDDIRDELSEAIEAAESERLRGIKLIAARAYEKHRLTKIENADTRDAVNEFHRELNE